VDLASCWGSQAILEKGEPSVVEMKCSTDGAKDGEQAGEINEQKNDK
jgi:hypothetical protein